MGAEVYSGGEPTIVGVDIVASRVLQRRPPKARFGMRASDFKNAF